MNYLKIYLIIITILNLIISLIGGIINETGKQRFVSSTTGLIGSIPFLYYLLNT